MSHWFMCLMLAVESCRWTKVTAMLDGQKVPFSFDNQGVSKLVPGAQVLKIHKKEGLGLTLAGLQARRVTLTVSVDKAAGARRCTSIGQLLNRTATPAWPLSIAFFSTAQHRQRLAELNIRSHSSPKRQSETL